MCPRNWRLLLVLFVPASVVVNVVTQDGYYLPKELVEQLDNWKDANSHVKNLEYNDTRFGNPTEGWRPGCH